MNIPILKLSSVIPISNSALVDAFGIVPCKGGKHRAGKRYSEGIYTCTYCRLPLVRQVMIDIIENSLSPFQAVASINPCASRNN